MSDKTKSLDAKIAAALATDGDVDRNTLIDLIRDATAAIETANIVITAETPRLMDLSNDEPDKSRELIASSQLRVDRLTSAIPRLQQRIDQIDLEARQAAWTEQAEALRGEADDIFWELEQVYKPFVEQFDALFVRARANAAAFHELLSRAPAGVDRRFNEASPWENFWVRVMLPDWSDSRVTHPPRRPLPDPLIEIALMQAAFAKQLDAKMLISAGQQREIDAKREEEMQQKAREEQEQYFKSVAEADRRRARGEI